MQILVVCNLKGGAGKTTTAVFLAHVLAGLGRRVLLVDADPQYAASRWSEVGFPFPTIGMARRNLHAELPGIARDLYDVVIVDTPPTDLNRAIVTSALRVADLAVVTLAPTMAEMETLPDMWTLLADVVPLRLDPLDVAVLLNRTITGAASTGIHRATLRDQGHHVLDAIVPRREWIAQSHGAPVDDPGPYVAVAEELLARRVSTS